MQFSLSRSAFDAECETTRRRAVDLQIVGVGMSEQFFRLPKDLQSWPGRAGLSDWVREGDTPPITYINVKTRACKMGNPQLIDSKEASILVLAGVTWKSIKRKELGCKSPVVAR
jgi:hypothetical protein